MAHLVRFIERITGGFGWLAAWLVAPLIVATVYEVLSRYLFNAPTIWAYELGYMAMGTNFLLGAAFTLREGAHIRIDVMFTHYRTKTKALIDTLGYLVLFLPVTFWLSWRLWLYALDAFESGELSGQSAWNPVIWPFRTVFFIGFVLLALQGSAQLIKCIYLLRDKPVPGRELPY